MIDFDLSPEHREVERAVREYAAREVAPRIRELDEKGEYDPKIGRQLGELGFLGICVPRRYGGAGLDYIALGLASEELEYVDTFLRVFLSVHTGLNCMSLLTWGTEEQKQRWLVPQAKGELLAGYALTEPNAGSDVVGLQSTAVKRGDRYVLNGEKTWISLADVADTFLVVAWTDLDKKQRRDHSGLTAFMIERGTKGLETGTLHGKLSVRAGNTGWLAFRDMELPAANRIGAEGDGFKIAMFALDQGRFTVAAGATGLVRACRDASVKYARERTTAGRPIGEHQLVKQMIAEMEGDYESCRLLWLRAGWLKNEGRRNTRETSLAKWRATVASEKAAGNAVQVFGAYGCNNEAPVERFYRNCKAAVIYEGTREIHTVMQADYALGYRTDRPLARSLPKYEAEP